MGLKIIKMTKTRRMLKPSSPINEIGRLREKLKSKQGHLTMLQDALKQKEQEILVLKAGKLNLPNKELTGMKQCIKQKNNVTDDFKKVIFKQNKAISEFKGSIVYPLFLFTKRIGKTKLGNKLESLIKGKKK